MNKILKEKIMEAFLSVLPITVIVLVISVVLAPMPSGTILMFLTGAALLIIGMGFFVLGADMALMPMGEGIGIELTKSSKLLLIIPVIFIIGFIISVAEPDLQVLGRQTPAIPGWVLILTVSLGVGLFFVIALLRIFFKIPLSILLLVSYLIVFTIVLLAPDTIKPFIPVGFDSGGVTTGPVTVPFILAVGVGAASVRGDKDSQDDSFGLVAMCSVGPIITVLLLGLFYKTGSSEIEPFIIPEANTSRDVARHFLIQLPTFFREISAALGAIVICFIVFQLFTGRYKHHQLGRIAVGFSYTLIGLVLFLTGVNVGFFPEGRLLGYQLASSPYKWVLVPLGAVVGYYIVAAEPAVHVLNKQVEEISAGSITQKMMMKGLAIGMSVALTITMLRILLRIPIMYILVPGYAIALSLTLLTPKIFTGIAFDSGGVCSGPMTSTFLLPLAIGTCEGSGGDVMIDAFGIVAMVVMTPLIVIQLMGLIYHLKQKEAVAVQIEQTASTIGSVTLEEIGHITVFEDILYG
jgi:hypothetical protein